MVFAFCEQALAFRGGFARDAALCPSLCANLPLLSGTSPGAHTVARHNYRRRRAHHTYHAYGRPHSPPLSRVVAAKGRQLGRDLGVIYRGQYVRRIFGTITAGFFLLPALGMSVSLLMAAAINCFGCGLAIFVVRRYTSTGSIEASVQTPEISLGSLCFRRGFFPWRLRVRDSALWPLRSYGAAPVFS